MDKLIEPLINYGLAGIMLGICLVVIYKGWKWFTDVHLPAMKDERAKETAAIIAQLERLILQQDAAAKTQAVNEEKIVGALESVKGAVSKGFADMKKRFEELEGRVKKLEEKQ